MDPLLKILLRLDDEEEPLDFQKIAAETNRPPSEEAKKMLNQREPEFSDFREMMTNFGLGLLPTSPTSGTGAEYVKGHGPAPERVHPAMPIIAREPSPVGLFVKAWIEGDEQTQRKLARELMEAGA